MMSLMPSLIRRFLASGSSARGNTDSSRISESGERSRSRSRMSLIAVAGVVGADHQHVGLGIDSLELAVEQAPQHVLGAVARVAEIQRLAPGVELLPDLLAGPAPALGDRVTDKDQLVPPLPDL